MATIRSKTKKGGGFDCEFVEKPPEALQSKCPICKLILREPYQAPCCGNSFCRVCIERIKTDRKLCPICNEANFVTFHNKGLQITLCKFQVYCSHKQEGCEWKGELGQLDDHLNLSQQPDKQLEGCEYNEIACIYCSELIKNPEIIVHQNDLCPKRLFSCEYCHSYKSHYEDVINNHWPVCGYHPVRCPNGCGTFPQRQGLENHVINTCPNTVIDCDFQNVGCDVRLPRKDMPAHLKADLINHMSLQAVNYKVVQEKVNKLESDNELLKSQLEETQTKLEAAESKLEATQLESQQATAKIRKMQQKIDTLQLSGEDDSRMLRAIERSCKIRTFDKNEFAMQNFEQHKRDGSTWYSPPFYSHPRGYKLCLRVDANGSGRGQGTHVSVYVYIMKGEFDAYLDWPFRGRIIIHLLSKEGKSHYEIFRIEEKKRTTYNRRVTEGERNKNGWGMDQFISHRALRSGYIRNNCLYFYIIYKRV